MKTRLDQIILDKGLAQSIALARAYIMEGRVKINGIVADKQGYYVSKSDQITITEEGRYVSRGGYKLEGALHNFSIDVNGLIAMDVGASTGGFTDCLLQHGAQKVYAIDVGYGLTDYKLRKDARVILMEKVNFRHFYTSVLALQIDIATIDVSFISLELILPNVSQCVKENGTVLALIKPQFELDKKDVDKGGVINSPEKHKKAVTKISDLSLKLGFRIIDIAPAIIKGTEGNQEFFIYLKK